MDHIHLLGSEKVGTAGAEMSRAAESIAQSVGHQSEENRRHEMALADLVVQFTEQVDRLVAVSVKRERA